jgi:hypothetical protein
LSLFPLLLAAAAAAASAAAAAAISLITSLRLLLQKQAFIREKDFPSSERNSPLDGWIATRK